MLPQWLLLATQRIEAGQEDQAEGEEQHLSREQLKAIRPQLAWLKRAPSLQLPFLAHWRGAGESWPEG